MPDSVPDHDTPASNRPAEHISSPQWQSFEMRMRARRADRCFQRASSAVESGSVTEAREALDEARHLSPSDPRVADLDSRLATLSALQIAAPTMPELDVIHPVELKTFNEPQPADGTHTNVTAAFTEPAAVAKEIDIDDFDSTPYSDSVIGPEIPATPPVWQAPQAASVSAGAFEPVLDLDRLRTPVVATWSGVTLGAPSRDRSLSAGVLVCGLLLSALAGWQAWEHKDQWNSFLPSAQPDVDANTGLAAHSPRPEPVAAPAVQEPSSPASLAAAPSHPEPVVPEPAQHEDGSPDPALRASGTSGDAAPAAAVRPSVPPPSPELTAAAARREPEVSTTATTGVLPRQPESTAVLPAIDSRTSTPLTSTATPPATAPDPVTPTPSPLPTPSVPPPSPPSSGAQANPAFARTEPSPPLPAPGPPPPASSASPATTSSTATPNASAPTASSSVRDQSAAVRAALTRYETAYSKLDVSAVQSVWPSLDQHALSRAFDGLTSQRVSLGTCSVNVKGRAARADCSGTAAWTPKIGGGERTASRKWTFDLSESDGAWRIVRVQAR